MRLLLDDVTKGIVCLARQATDQQGLVGKEVCFGSEHHICSSIYSSSTPPPPLEGQRRSEEAKKAKESKREKTAVNTAGRKGVGARILESVVGHHDTALGTRGIWF